MVGLFLGSISKHEETRSRMRPSSFFLSKMEAFARPRYAFSLTCWFVDYYPANLCGWAVSRSGLLFSTIFLAIGLNSNFLELLPSNIALYESCPIVFMKFSKLKDWTSLSLSPSAPNEKTSSRSYPPLALFSNYSSSSVELNGLSKSRLNGS